MSPAPQAKPLVEPRFTVSGVRVEPHAAVPTLMLTLAIEVGDGRALEGMALHHQLRLDPARRAYGPDESARLVDLFGAPSRWSSTMRALAWCEGSLLVPPFAGRVEVELPIACSYDLEVASARYLHALDGGDLPICLLFRGSVFARGAAGLEMTPLPWRCETTWRLPHSAWHAAIDGHYPDTGWLRLRRDTLLALVALKGRHGLGSFDDAIAMLLDEVQR